MSETSCGVWLYVKRKKSLGTRNVHTHTLATTTHTRKCVSGNGGKHVHRCKAPEQHWPREATDHLAAFSAPSGALSRAFPSRALGIYITPTATSSPPAHHNQLTDEINYNSIYIALFHNFWLSSKFPAAITSHFVWTRHTERILFSRLVITHWRQMSIFVTMSYAGLFVLAAFLSITSGSITNLDDEEKVHCRVRDLKKNCSPF